LQVEDVSVDRQLIFTGVFRDGDDSFYAVAVGSEGLDEEIDIYHAEEFTGCRFRSAWAESRMGGGDALRRVGGSSHQGGSTAGSTGVLFTRVGRLGLLNLGCLSS
jgi:hypothetical protein